ncbi:hypothetical protein [Escherichia coli]|uniref:hypothetical protein n=1 Tax=Escherichia coli TaxID=562 RepID=UPI002FCD2B2A
MLVSMLTGRGFLTTMLMMSGPILLIGAAIAAVVALVWKFWEPIKAFFSGFIQGFSDAWRLFHLALPFWPISALFLVLYGMPSKQH